MSLLGTYDSWKAGYGDDAVVDGPDVERGGPVHCARCGAELPMLGHRESCTPARRQDVDRADDR